MPKSTMETQQKSYSQMAVKDSELESFLPSQISSPVSRRKRILHKFALLGWILNIIQFAIICYGWIHPRAPTDLECTRQLNAWCKLRYYLIIKCLIRIKNCITDLFVKLRYLTLLNMKTFNSPMHSFNQAHIKGNQRQS